MKPVVLLRVLVVASSVALVPLLLACDKGAQSGPDHPVGGPPEDDKPPPAATEIDQAVNAGKGQACAIDKDCAFYLRCVQAVCAMPPAVDGAAAGPDTPAAAIITPHGEVQFHLEVANGAEERNRGLMYRPRMSDEWGMIFPYPNDRELTFWMKNTYIPLDMVFVNTNLEVVGVVKNATPFTLEERKVTGKSRYVIELNAGLADRFGIAPGQKVFLANMPEPKK